MERSVMKNLILLYCMEILHGACPEELKGSE